MEILLIFLALGVAGCWELDAEGNYKFGFATSNTVRKEMREPDGAIRGFYDYLDANGVVQHVEYTADKNGFKVRATNLPIHISVVKEAEAASATSTAKNPSKLDESAEQSSAPD